jgi:hypothetical protein
LFRWQFRRVFCPLLSRRRLFPACFLPVALSRRSAADLPHAMHPILARRALRRTSDGQTRTKTDCQARDHFQRSPHGFVGADPLSQGNNGLSDVTNPV